MPQLDDQPRIWTGDEEEFVLGDIPETSTDLTVVDDTPAQQ